MSSPTGLQLDRVVLLGRTLPEYCEYFALNLSHLKGKKILDVASGVSSFTAEASAAGLDVTAVDPIYSLDPQQISRQSDADLDLVATSVQGLDTYRWDYYRSVEGLREFRRTAKNLFLADFQNCPQRYVPAKLPSLPFRAAQFDLTLVSYFLLVYQAQFDYPFHRAAFLELLRVTREELRIYPIVTFEAQRSSYLELLSSDPAFRDYQFDLVQTDFEFLKNSNYFLRVRSKVSC